MKGKLIAACVTEGDRSNIALLKRAGVEFVTFPNQPLGAKANRAHELAKTFGADAYMWLPCDDFISTEWSVRAFKLIVKSGHHYVLPARAALHEPWTRRSCILDQTRRVNGCGAGRMWSATVADHVGEMWAPHAPRGLDFRSDQRITSFGYQRTFLDTERVPLVDVKSSRNIWSFNDWVKKGKHCTSDEVLWMLSSSERRVVAGFTGRK